MELLDPEKNGVTIDLSAPPASVVEWENARVDDLAKRANVSPRSLHGLILFHFSALRDAFWNPSEENDAAVLAAVERERVRGRFDLNA